ncbi:acyltransferase family protein [Corynebacterium uberis]|nr:acyltransferase family protein [Corynebacterium uberis]UDL75151.1 acyltransferase family protein [Corynebacterium uberis]UDL79647.1 acyltransferase family protein [Corynebacterium uberis]
MVATPLLPGATPAPTAASPASPRLAWPDVAKGVSILGVVVLHVSLVVPYGTDSFIAQVNHLLDPLRMPLFFLVSGMFSTKILRYSLWDL